MRTVFTLLVLVNCFAFNAEAKASSKGARIIAGACALLLATNHVSQVSEFVNHPEHHRHPDQIVLPVGAGGIRDSFAALLARATKTKQLDGDYKDRYLPTNAPIVHEYVIKYDFSQMSVRDVKNHVSFYVKEDSYMSGLMFINNVIANFTTQKVDDKVFYYEITNFDDGKKIGDGYLQDFQI